MLRRLQRYRKAAGLPAEEGEEAGSDDEPAAEPVTDLLPPSIEGEAPTVDDLNRLKRKLGHQRKVEEEREPLAPTVQGCLLAQALLKLGPDQAEVVVNSYVSTAESFGWHDRSTPLAKADVCPSVLLSL